MQHTHDTASTAVLLWPVSRAADNIDVRPLASAPAADVRSMAHALKGTGYSLDIDPDKMDEIESILNKDLSEYEFSPSPPRQMPVSLASRCRGRHRAKRAHDEIRRYPRQVQ